MKQEKPAVEAELEKQRAELRRQGGELARLRDKQRRSEATRLTEKALTTVRSKVTELLALDIEARARLQGGDRKVLLLMASTRTDPNNKKEPTAAAYYSARDKLITEARSRSRRLLKEAEGLTEETEKDVRLPAEMQRNFSAEAGRELARARALVDKPFPAPDLSIYRVEVARIKKELVEKAKKADERITRYYDKKRRSGQNLATLIRALGILQQIHARYVTKDLDEESMNRLIDLSRDRKVWEEARYIVALAGDWMPDYKDACHYVTIREAWSAFTAKLKKMLKDGNDDFDF
jgi:hypothetical protein